MSVVCGYHVSIWNAKRGRCMLYVLGEEGFTWWGFVSVNFGKFINNVVTV